MRSQIKRDELKIVLRRFGRNKRPVYKILVLNKANKYCFYLGSFELFSNRKLLTLCIDKTMLIFWLLSGASCSYKVYLLLHYLLVDNK